MNKRLNSYLKQIPKAINMHSIAKVIEPKQPKAQALIDIRNIRTAKSKQAQHCNVRRVDQAKQYLVLQWDLSEKYQVGHIGNDLNVGYDKNCKTPTYQVIVRRCLPVHVSITSVDGKVPTVET